MIDLKKDHLYGTWFNDFKRQYKQDHMYCPKCGCDSCSQTLVSYPLIRGHGDTYENKNRCICNQCGDRHLVHDRVGNK